jgi:hypothetical protein
MEMLIGTAPYIEFRLLRNLILLVKVQNRNLEQVVVVTSNLSATRFLDSSGGKKNISPEDL